MTKVATSHREKPLSPKHGTASPYHTVLSWNIFLDMAERNIKDNIAQNEVAAGVIQFIETKNWPWIKKYLVLYLDHLRIYLELLISLRKWSAFFAISSFQLSSV
jgi:hypothetical protein